MKKKKSPAKASPKRASRVSRSNDDSRGGPSDNLTDEAADLLAEALAFKEHDMRKLPITELVLRPQARHLGVTLSNHPLGVLINQINDNDMAYKGGLRAGDVLVAVNGTQVKSHFQAAELMFAKQLDPNLEINVAYHTAAVADREIIRRRKPTEFVAIDLVVGGRQGHVGLTLSNHPLGVLITAVDPHDLAYQAGIRTNDVLVTLNGYAVTHHADAVALINDVGEQKGSVRLTYYPAEAAANELVLVSSYGPRGSDLSDSGLVSTSSLGGRASFPGEPGTPTNGNRRSGGRAITNRTARDYQQARMKTYIQQQQAKIVEEGDDGLFEDLDFEMNYSATT